MLIRLSFTMAYCFHSDNEVIGLSSSPTTNVSKDWILLSMFSWSKCERLQQWREMAYVNGYKSSSIHSQRLTFKCEQRLVDSLANSDATSVYSIKWNAMCVGCELTGGEYNASSEPNPYKCKVPSTSSMKLAECALYNTITYIIFKLIPMSSF